MTRLSFDEKLSRLKKLGEGPCSDATVHEIHRALSGANSILAAEAALAAARLELSGLISDLVSAYYRFLQNPVKKDPGCHAKLAAVEALSVYGHNPECLDRIRKAVLKRGERTISEACKRTFPSTGNGPVKGPEPET